MEKGKMIINGVEVGGSFGSATSVPYSNTNSGLEATNVQGAIDELNSNFGGLTFGKDGEGNVGYFGADGSLIPFKRIPEGYYPAKQLSGSFSQTINGGGSSWTGETDVTITFDPPFNTAPINVDVWETSMTTKYFRNNQVYCVPIKIEPDHCVVRIYSNIQWTSVNDFKWEAIAFYE